MNTKSSPAKPARFEAYEINPVCEQTDADGHVFCSAHIDLASAEEEAEETGGRVIWTLYGHREEEGVEAIADSVDEAAAFALLYSITGIEGVSGKRIYQLPKQRTATAAEIATILHALRVYQDDLQAGDAPEEEGCDHFEDVKPLTTTQIDTLCESINLDSLVFLNV